MSTSASDHDQQQQYAAGEFIARRLVPFDPEFSGIFSLRQLEAIPLTELPAGRSGNRVVYRRSDLRAYLARQMSGQPLESKIAMSVVEALVAAGVVVRPAGRPRRPAYQVPQLAATDSR